MVFEETFREKNSTTYSIFKITKKFKKMPSKKFLIDNGGITLRGRQLRIGLVACVFLTALICGNGYVLSEMLSNKDIEINFEAPEEIFFDAGQDSSVVPIDLSLITKPQDVLLVVDTKSSMEEADVQWEGEYITRMEAQKNILHGYVMDFVDPSSNIGLITFGDGVEWTGFASKSETLLQIEGLKAHGVYGSIYDALYRAVQEVDNNSERRTVLLCFTDGASAIYSRNDHSFSEVEEFAREKNVNLNFVLIGHQSAEPLYRLSQNTGGVFLGVMSNLDAFLVAARVKELYSKRLADVALNVIPMRGSIYEGPGSSTWELLERGTTMKAKVKVQYPRWESGGQKEIAIIRAEYTVDGEKIIQETKVSSRVTLVGYWDKYRTQIVLGVFSIFLVMGLAILYQYKKYSSARDAESVLAKASDLFESRDYRKALQFYEEAFNLYRKSKHKSEITSTGNALNQCRASIQDLEEKKSILNRSVDQLDFLISKLRSLVGYDPPHGIYQILFRISSGIEHSMTGELIEEAKEYAENEDIDEIEVNIPILMNKIKEMQGIIDLVEDKRLSYRKSEAALKENLLRFKRLDKTNIQEICNVDETTSLLFLNFLIDDTPSGDISFDRESHIEIKSKDYLLFEKVFGKGGIARIKELAASLSATEEEILDLIKTVNLQEGISLRVDEDRKFVYEPAILQEHMNGLIGQGLNPETILKDEYGITEIPDDIRGFVYRHDRKTPKMDVVCRYLEKDVPGIEKICNLRDMLNVDDEEISNIIKSIIKSQGNRYYVDWFGENVLVDYVTLLNHIEERYKNGEAIADIVRGDVAGCKIPREIRERVPDDMGV